VITFTIISWTRLAIETMPILTLSYGTVVQWALALLLVAYPRQDVCTDLFPGIGKLQMKSRSYIFAKKYSNSSSDWAKCNRK